LKTTFSSIKKAPAFADAFLVELVGTAPTSAGLPWLIVYRFSLFKKFRKPALKQTKKLIP